MGYRGFDHETPLIHTTASPESSGTPFFAFESEPDSGFAFDVAVDPAAVERAIREFHARFMVLSWGRGLSYLELAGLPPLRWTRGVSCLQSC